MLLIESHSRFAFTYISKLRKLIVLETVLANQPAFPFLGTGVDKNDPLISELAKIFEYYIFFLKSKPTYVLLRHMVGFENLVKSMIVSILLFEIKSYAVFLLPKYNPCVVWTQDFLYEGAFNN